MAYVGLPLVFDLLISYSHGDDGGGNANLASWPANEAWATSPGLSLNNEPQRSS
jgi:hypothetical protein